MVIQRTKRYQICPGLIHGEQYLFIDTIGFGAKDTNNLDNFQDIIACLDAVSPFLTIAGLLFVYGGNGTRMVDNDLTTIQWVKCFCGPEFYRYITLVTTRWDDHQEEGFEQRQTTYSSLINDAAVSELLAPPNGTYHLQRFDGAATYRHGIKEDENCSDGALPTRLSPKRHRTDRAQQARTMIINRYSKVEKAKLQILKELEDNTHWMETEAAKILVNEKEIGDIKLHIIGDRIQVSDHKTPQENVLVKTHPKLDPRLTPKLEPGPQPESEQPKPQSTWLDMFFGWIGVLYEVAVFFRDAHKAATNPGGRDHGTYDNTWAGIWGRFRERWLRPEANFKEAGQQ